MSPKLKKVFRIAVVGGVVVFGLIQLVPVKGVGTNPPERFDIGAPPEVAAIMRRACFDCHSNETRWPFYSRIAPLDWVVARDVVNGRSHLNFSEWADSDEEERQLDRENCWDQIEAGEMPPWFYIFPVHSDAKLSDADRAALKAWFLKDKGKFDDKADDAKDDDADSDGAKGDGDGDADAKTGADKAPDRAATGGHPAK